MTSISYKIKKVAYQCCWKLISLSWLLVRRKKSSTKIQENFSIGVVTYIARFEKYFKPLIKQLLYCFPDTQLIIVINGYYDRKQQEAYLIDIRHFLGQFPNVTIIDYLTGQSLSKLWNQIIINSRASQTLILNDDLKLLPWFRKDLEKSGLLSEQVGLINRSWSHFIINRNIIEQIGWFDERFPGVGNEDEDYESRLVWKEIQVKSFRIASVQNVVFKTRDFSYGKQMETVNVKYVKENKVFFDSKWECSTSPKTEFKYVAILNCYTRLKPSMETPDFYKNITWQSH